MELTCERLWRTTALAALISTAASNQPADGHADALVSWSMARDSASRRSSVLRKAMRPFARIPDHEPPGDNASFVDSGAGPLAGPKRNGGRIIRGIKTICGGPLLALAGAVSG